MHWVMWASSVLAFLLYYNTLDSGFVYDDRRVILTNPDVLGHTPAKALFQNDFWGTPLTDEGSHGSYRPLSVFTYRFNYAISGLRPWSYHFINVLLHCITTALVVVTARKFLPRSCVRVGTAVTGLTFAAHPIHTEAVSSIHGRADVLACTLFLLSFLLYNEHLKLRDVSNKSPTFHRKDDILRSRSITTSDQNFRLSCHGLVQQIFTNFRKLLKSGRVGPLRLISGHGFAYDVKTETSSKTCESVSEDCDLLQWMTLAGTLFLGVAATLCKEPAIMVIPLCIMVDIFRGSRQDITSKNRWRSISVLSAGCVGLLYWRLRLTGTPTFAKADNPTAHESSIITRTLTFTYLPVFNFYLLLYPFQLSFDWSMDAIPRITSIFDPRNILSAIFYTALSKIAWKAIRNEFIRELSDKKEIKPYKSRGNFKAKYKSNFHGRHPHRGTDSADRRAYHVPHREAAKKQLCPCNGCRRPISDEHTGACRTVNNNNYLSHHSCVCAPIKLRRQKTHIVYNTPREALLIFVALTTLPFVPASNALYYVGFVVAERVLYLPSVGFCLLLGLGAGVVTRGWNRGEWRSKLFMGSLLLCLVAMCGRTMRRNLDWRDEESLFKSALHINPPKAYSNLGSILSSQGRNAEAEVAFQMALLHRPNMADAHYNLGILLQNQRRYEAAIKSFEEAIHFRPSMALAYLNLGVSLKAIKRISEAISVLRAGARADGTRVRDRREHDQARVSALVQLAELHIERSRYNKALESYKDALRIIPSEIPTGGWTRRSLLMKREEILGQLKKSKTESSVLAALAEAPRDAATHLAYARLLAENTSRSLEAEERFKKAIELAPENPVFRYHFGQFLIKQKRVQDAAKHLVAAAELLPTDARLAAAAARTLRIAYHCENELKSATHCLVAERLYARAAQLSPEDAESHMNLGAILHANGKHAAAADLYRRALQLQPNDEITLKNLRNVNKILMTNSHRT